MKLHHIGFRSTQKTHPMPYSIAHRNIRKCRDPLWGDLTLYEDFEGNRYEFFEDGENHVCFEVCDVAQTETNLRAAGYIPTGKRGPAMLFDGRQVSFMYGAMGLIELLESE